MLKYFIPLVMILLIGLTASCSGSSPAETNVNLGQQFNLKFAQTASINGEPLMIKFSQLVSDSRCPTGAVCVWEGEVSCLLDITYQNVLNQKIITKSGSSTDLASSDFDAYIILFDVQPYPEVDKQIKDEDYSLKLIIKHSGEEG